MSINESSANTLVRFTGLGIICFNESEKRGEIGLIRDEKHSLSVKIQKAEFLEGTEKDLIAYKDWRVFENLPKEGLEIEIKPEKNPSVEGYEIYQSNGNFSRLDGDDFNDFRWIVDLNDLHGENLVNQNGKEKYPVSKLFISGGLFYTHKLDTELFFEKIEKDANGNERERELFGSVAETIGVKIEADAVLFRIKYGETEDTEILEKTSGLPFRIEIKNMDYNEGASYSDMPDYYKYLASASGEKIELEPVREDDGAEDGGAVTGKQFCHPIRAEIGTIKTL